MANEVEKNEVVETVEEQKEKVPFGQKLKNGWNKVKESKAAKIAVGAIAVAGGVLAGMVIEKKAVERNKTPELEAPAKDIDSVEEATADEEKEDLSEE